MNTTQISNKTLGEVNIHPNPATGNNLQVTYQINPNASNVKMVITNVQGKKVYESPLNMAQKKATQNLNINLPAGTYLYYLANNTQKTSSQKLIIQ